jgi:hypothetical protein
MDCAQTPGTAAGMKKRAVPSLPTAMMRDTSPCRAGPALHFGRATPHCKVSHVPLLPRSCCRGHREPASTCTIPNSQQRATCSHLSDTHFRGSPGGDRQRPATAQTQKAIAPSSTPCTGNRAALQLPACNSTHVTHTSCMSELTEGDLNRPTDMKGMIQENRV